jgi:hypothetical protein
MPSPTVYKGLPMFDKSKKRTEGITPHAAAYHPPSHLFLVATSRRTPFVSHLPTPEDTAEDPHAAFSYRLAQEAARAHKGEMRCQLRAVAADTLATECEHKFQPLEHLLCVESARPCPTPTRGHQCTKTHSRA